MSAKWLSDEIVSILAHDEGRCGSCRICDDHMQSLAAEVQWWRAREANAVRPSVEGDPTP